MTDTSSSTGNAPRAGATHAEGTGFLDAFADHWVRGGGGRTEGRVLAYLLTAPTTSVSSAELMAALPASAGAVSTATRTLVAAGYVARLQRPGDRSHYFAAHEDVGGSRLAALRGWSARARVLLGAIAANLPGDDARAQRLRACCDFLEWQASCHERLLQDWQAFRAAQAEARHSG